MSPNSARIARFMMNHTCKPNHSTGHSNTCPICLEGEAEHLCVQIYNVQGCNHLIGYDCLKAMLSFNEDDEKRCPLCRTVWLEEKGVWQNTSNFPYTANPRPEFTAASAAGRMPISPVFPGFFPPFPLRPGNRPHPVVPRQSTFSARATTTGDQAARLGLSPQANLPASPFAQASRRGTGPLDPRLSTRGQHVDAHEEENEILSATQNMHIAAQNMHVAAQNVASARRTFYRRLASQNPRGSRTGEDANTRPPYGGSSRNARYGH